jgi:uncharacterized protein RhaS with RHS repeats
MGARVYLPGIGRFASVDPVDGGVENRYVYPADPVNEFDLTGEAAFLIPVGLIVVRGVSAYAAKVAAQKAAQAAAKKAAQKAAQAAAKKAANSWKKLDSGMVKKLERRGLIRTHGRGGDKIGGSRQDIFVDKKTGELYAKPKNGRGPGEPLGVNIKNL